MAGTLGSLIVDIAADVARLRADMGKAERVVSSSMASIRKAAGIAGAALSGVASSLAAGFSVQAIRNVIATTSELYDQAQKLGIASEALQAYEYAGQQVALNQRTVNLAIQRFSRRIGEAAQGSGELLKTLKQYGIELRDSNGRLRTTEDILGDLAEVIKNTADAQERLRIAQKAFDSEGVGFLNVLRGGREGLERLKQEAIDAGLVLDEALVKKAKELDGAITRLAQSISVKFKAAILSIAVAIRDAFDSRPNLVFGKALDENRRQAEVLRQKLAEVEALRAAAPRAPRGRRGGSTGGDEAAELRQQLKELEAQDPQRALDALDEQIKEAQARAAEAAGTNRRSAQATVERLQTERAELERYISVQRELDELGAAGTNPPAPPIDTKSVKDANAKAKELIATLQKEAMTFGLTADELRIYDAVMLATTTTNEGLRNQLLETVGAFQKARAEFEKFNALETEADQLRDKLKTPYDVAFESLDRYDQMLDRNLVTIDEWARFTNAALDEAAEKVAKLDGAGEKATDSLTEAFEGLGDSIEQSVTDAVAAASLSLESLSELAESILESIAKQFIQKSIAAPLGGFFEGATKELFGYASGGYVKGGEPIVVGEEGPEIFTPGASGYITPNDKLGGMGGGGLVPPITVNLIEAPGGGGQVRQRQDGNRFVLDVLVEQIRDTFIKDVQAGGPFARAAQSTWNLNRAAGVYR